MNANLEHFYGDCLIVRTPSPVTINKAGANYKSETPHLAYSPRRAYDEWLSICDGILAFGGDALLTFEPDDEPFLGHAELFVDRDGSIRGDRSSARIGHIDDVLTGRVFSANGPWVVVNDSRLRALMPNMLAHRVAELPYYEALLTTIASETNLSLVVERNPHRWEGLADVAVIGTDAVFTYTVAGHYDSATEGRTLRSSREGVAHAAEFAHLEEAHCVFAELVYPHFHGDTVHFGLRPANGEPVLMHYAGGLFDACRASVSERVGRERIVPIASKDAVEFYAANSRQVKRGVLVPSGVSSSFVRQLEARGLSTRVIELFELFGKAGGGPGCATLQLPSTVNLPGDSGLRFSNLRTEAFARRERVAERVTVDPGYFVGKPRG